MSSDFTLTRRQALSAAAFAAPLFARTAPPDAVSRQMARILARIKPPVFPKRDFVITAYGAQAGGATSATAAIRMAIDECHAAGGGRVVVPAGSFLTGAIHLKSRVNLHLAQGAILLFSHDPNDYLPLVLTRFEGTELMNYSPFIYAWQQTDIAITGPGTLDGQAGKEHWWNWKSSREDRLALVAAADKDVPVADRVFGPGRHLRPNFVQPYRCKNVLIEGVSVRRSPMWEINPVLCTNVTVRGLDIATHGPNNDGCNPECCTDVLIEKCTFDTGDDCIAIKSGRNHDGRRVGVACSNLIVRDCQMKDGHGGVTIGSEVSGDVRNVYVDNCHMDSPHLDRALRIKTNAQRGGIVENVYFRNVQVGQVADSVVSIDFFYEEGENGPMKPVVRNIVVENVTCKKSRYGVFLRGFKNSPITGVTLNHCTFENTSRGNVVENVQGYREIATTIATG
jgi:polygalacturonase